ncbi:unnamed protein product [Ceratitis capitata]|uniref:(Mediterranean fruit fly) hypothetical protein n=1 Tax=Ceratitis capitata TaxID=7213 RepID=A0A811UHC9_CERCA|nr:unnamed protein product [Ceratitis capitata]
MAVAITVCGTSTSVRHEDDFFNEICTLLPTYNLVRKCRRCMPAAASAAAAATAATHLRALCCAATPSSLLCFVTCITAGKEIHSDALRAALFRCVTNYRIE